MTHPTELLEAAERLLNILDGDDPREWIGLGDVRCVAEACLRLVRQAAKAGGKPAAKKARKA